MVSKEYIMQDCTICDVKYILMCCTLRSFINTLRSFINNIKQDLYKSLQVHKTRVISQTGFRYSLYYTINSTLNLTLSWHLNTDTLYFILYLCTYVTREIYC